MQISPTLTFLFLFVREKTIVQKICKKVAQKPWLKKMCMFFLRYKKKGFHEGTANSRLVIIGALTDKKLTWKEGMND